MTIDPKEHRKREYVLFKRAGMYYYARASRTDPDVYDVMAQVGEREGKMIIERANATSDFNRVIDNEYNGLVELATTTFANVDSVDTPEKEPTAAAKPKSKGKKRDA